MNPKPTLISLLAISFLVGCNEDARVPSLESRIVALESANKVLKDEIEMAKFQADILDWDRIAFMKPGNDGYTTIRFDLGVLTVKLADVKPYANGSKITLNFGNLTSAKVDGLRAKLDWGKVDEKGNPQNDKAKSREVSFSEALMPGAWTSTELVLEGIPPTELGFVRLKEVGHRAISLRR